MKTQFDYKLLQALAVVVKEQSFERAAASIFITQSAVSQRIKQLEQFVSQPVLIRSTPPKPTAIGKKLINHFYQIEQLERELIGDILPQASNEPLTVHIAVNADSLATWFIPSIAETLKSNQIELNLQIADEQYTIEKLRDGEVFGAVTLHDTPLKGCQVSYLGEFNYVLVCTESFKQQYFADGVSADAIKRAPSAAFDQKDDMHINFIKQRYNLNKGDYPLHHIRSSEAFVLLAKNGVAFCLIAEMLVKDLLASGELVEPLPEVKITKKLYWQSWATLKGVHRQISDAIITNGANMLQQ